MIASENEALLRTAKNSLHSAAIGFDAGGVRVVETAAVHCAPEVRVQFEIGAAPFLAHRAEQALQMFLRFGMRAIKRVPGPAPPSAERDFARWQRRAFCVPDEPVGMPLKYVRIGLGDEWSYPDSRFK